MIKILENLFPIFEMANLRGKIIKVDNINFSFFFSSKSAVKHSIKAKIDFDPTVLRHDLTSNLRLCNDWKFTKNKKVKKISQSQINEAVSFFKKYASIFTAAWIEIIPMDALDRYLQGIITLEDVVNEMKIDDKMKQKFIFKNNDIETFEEFIVENNIFKIIR